MNVLLLALAVFIGATLAGVHYTLRFQRQKILTNRLNLQFERVDQLKRNLAKMEARRSDAQIMMGTRELLLDTQECLTVLHRTMSPENFDEVEFVLDLLDGRPVPFVEKERVSKSDLIKHYEHTRGWETRVINDLQMIAEHNSEPTLPEEPVKKAKKRSRKNTYLNLNAAGINLPRA